MPARLIALDDDHVLLLDKPIILIGRHEECDIQLESRKVSRRHCCIAQVDDCLAVRDLESTNGIRINGNQVTEGRLQEGDELMVGNLRYRVSWEDGPLDRPSVERERQARAARQELPVAEPIAPDNLVSCDMPVPIRESNAGPRASSVPIRPSFHGTERAEEKSANGSSGHHHRGKVRKYRKEERLRDPLMDDKGD